jgi:GT2 family glycosyltransferase
LQIILKQTIAKERINMEKTETVAAVTVTFNRISTLENTLKALLGQSRRPDYIIIVDNCSTEINKEKLKTLTAGKENVDIVWMQENLGGAGGFENGMRYAHQKYAPDWYWIMDDDAYPRTDTLERLLEHRELKNVGCLAPLIYGVDRQEYQLYHHKSMRKCYVKDAAKFSDLNHIKEVETIDADAFVGPLFPKHVVEEMGYPDGGLFIYGDDTEYTTRVHQKYEIYLIKAAVIDHNDPPAASTGFKPETYWKLYYNIRNRVIIANKYNKGAKKILGIFYLTCELFKQTGYSLLRKGLGKYRYLRISCVASGFFDGMKGRKGKTMDPEKFLEKVSQY